MIDWSIFQNDCLNPMPVIFTVDWFQSLVHSSYSYLPLLFIIERDIACFYSNLRIPKMTEKQTPIALFSDLENISSIVTSWDCIFLYST